MAERPVERRTHVDKLRHVRCMPRRVRLPQPILRRTVEKVTEVLRVPTFAAFGFSHFGEFLQRIGAGGLEQSVARINSARVGNDQRARHELREQVDNGERVDGRIGGDC